MWDGLTDSRIVFSVSDVDADTVELARLTENLNLQRALLLRLGELSKHVSIIDSTKVEHIEAAETGNSWPIVKLSNGDSLRARLLVSRSIIQLETRVAHSSLSSIQVGADGFKSPVRTFAGIDSYGWNYPTHAVVATLQHPSTATPAPESGVDLGLDSDTDSEAYLRTNSVAYQRFLQTGPIASLPLNERTSSMVWSTSPPLAAVLKAVKPTVLAALVNAAFRLPEQSMRYLNEYLLEHANSASSITLEEMQDEIAACEMRHQIDSSSPLFSSSLSSALMGVPPIGSSSYPPLLEGIQPGSQAGFPLKLSHATEYVKGGSRVALVGDAAHTVHPLAGQGLNMGIADVEALTNVVRDTLSLGGDIGKSASIRSRTAKC